MYYCIYTHEKSCKMYNYISNNTSKGIYQIYIITRIIVYIIYYNYMCIWNYLLTQNNDCYNLN